jgi:alkylation response protein AidB-like acyl-CoA dehydrogenase
VDLNLSPAEEAFRQEFVAWISENLRDDERESRLKGLPEKDVVAARRAWEQKLGQGGWLGVAWPREYGGRGATAMEQVIYLQELLAADAPQPMDMLGLDMMGPTVIEAGSDEQKRRFLPPIMRGEVVWCQAFSEPDAGSDLAGLKTRAVLDGDEWVLNGQKIWSSQAQYADWSTVLARTDPDAPKHKGITFFVIDMKTPGITLQPIKQISGESEFNEIFLDNVRVPRDNVIGEVNGGWPVANRFLAYERGVITMAMLSGYQRLWEEMRDYARVTRRSGTLLADDPRTRERLARTYTDIQLMRLANVRYITQYMRGATPGFETSIMKLYWAPTEQNLCDLATTLGGPDTLSVSAAPHSVADGEWMRKYLFSRVASVYGGTQDIQRNIVAERIYGLPRA